MEHTWDGDTWLPLYLGVARRSQPHPPQLHPTSIHKTDVGEPEGKTQKTGRFGKKKL